MADSLLRLPDNEVASVGHDSSDHATHIDGIQRRQWSSPLKPKLTYRSGRWYCRGSKEPGGCGSTPFEAYLVWRFLALTN